MKMPDSSDFFNSLYQAPLVSLCPEVDWPAINSKLCKIRAFEIVCASYKKRGLIGGPVHLGIGQEAIATCISHFLINNQDIVYSAHRSHAHIISLDTCIESLAAEILGLASGLCQGRGGSMHLIDRDNKFGGSVPIVAGTVPIAVGAALAKKLLDDTAVSVVYLGDGACEEGVFHESLNLAKVLNLPIIFVVENNLFASHMNITQRQPSSSIKRFGIANGIHSVTVDGNNVPQQLQEYRNCFDLARQDRCPVLIEAVTYRWLGHVDWRDDIDVGLERSHDDISNWKKRDPINHLIKCAEYSSLDLSDLTESYIIEYSAIFAKLKES